jgi:hypothetical protein
MPVERAYTWVQGERTEVEGHARRWRDAHGGGEGAHAYEGGRRARQLGGAHVSGGRARLWEGAHLDAWGAHGGGGARTGVERARTLVQRRAVVVEGALKGKASICKRSFLLNYPHSEYID